MVTLESKKIAIIGAGNMGNAFAEGIIKYGKAIAEKVIVANPNKSKLISLKDKLNIKITTNNIAAVKYADWVILAVKPALVKTIIEEIKEYLEDKIIISSVAAVHISAIEKYAKNKNVKVVRVMPNIPITVGKGVIGFYPKKNISTSNKKEIVNLLKTLGNVIEVKHEKEIDLITLISGCGPALVTYFMEQMVILANLYGFSKKRSFDIVHQTFLGTNIYLTENTQNLQQVKDVVATKGGITEKILKSLDEGGLPLLFEKSMQEGYSKISEVSNLYK
ncbi:MAG: pyrroline-5-carboxylate reductase [Patescibacteria group bacterium]